MPETLLTPSSIKLFGRIVSDLDYKDRASASAFGFNNFLQSQLSAGVTTVTVVGTTQNANTTVNTLSVAGLFPGMSVSAIDPGNNPVFLTPTQIVSVTNNGFTVSSNANILQAANNVVITAISASPRARQKAGFARIYAFSFEGMIYTLPKPAIFLVHGPGQPVDSTQPAKGSHTTLDESGVIAREWEFAAQDNRDIVFWEYEKGDFSIRFDTEAGPFEQILLSAVLRAGADIADRSGANLGVRSGANLSGANLSGANLSGANLRNR
jgi:hypothetical protein